MQRRGKRRRRKPACSSVRSDECECGFPLEEALDAERAAEVLKVRTAAEVDVLTIVDGFAGRLINERARAASPAGTRLEQRHAQPRAPGEGRGGGQSGQPSADDHDLGWHA